jgi:hypothetical protein
LWIVFEAQQPQLVYGAYLNDNCSCGTSLDVPLTSWGQSQR